MDIKPFSLLFLLSFGSCSIIIPEELPSLLSVAYSNIPPIKKEGTPIHQVRTVRKGTSFQTKQSLYCGNQITDIEQIFILRLRTNGHVPAQTAQKCSTTVCLEVGVSNPPTGNDHRIGFGFAFGNHADVQFMLELGPQTNTMNLTGQPFPSSSSNTKRQAPSLPPSKINKNKDKYHQSDGGNYLLNWAQKMKYPHKPIISHHEAPQEPRPGDVPNLEESVVELVKNDKGEYEIHQPIPGNMPSNVLETLMKLYGQKKEEAKKITEQKRSDEEVKRITEDLSNVDLE